MEVEKKKLDYILHASKLPKPKNKKLNDPQDSVAKKLNYESQSSKVNKENNE